MHKLIPLTEFKESRRARFWSTALVLLYCSTSAMPEVRSESVAHPGRLTGTGGGTPVWSVCTQQAGQARVGPSAWTYHWALWASQPGWASLWERGFLVYGQTRVRAGHSSTSPELYGWCGTATWPRAAPGSSCQLVTPVPFEDNESRKGSNVARPITTSDFAKLLLYNPEKEINRRLRVLCMHPPTFLHTTP